MKSSFNVLSILLLLILSSCNESNLTDDKSIVPKAENFIPVNRKINKLHSQIVYVPIYSSIQGHMNELTHLSAILSIRNISPYQEIFITQIDYFDTSGKQRKRLSLQSLLNQ